MTALLRIIVGVLALSLLSNFARAETQCCVNFILIIDKRLSEKIEETGRALHQDLMAVYEALKARQKGIFNEQISATIEKRINNGTLFDEADTILQAAGFEPLRVSRVQDERPNAETYFSNLVLRQGFSAKIIVNVIITFKSMNGVLEVDHIEGRMIAHYL